MYQKDKAASFKRGPISDYSNENDDYDDIAFDQVKMFTSAPILLSLINMFTFAFGLTLFVIGILYLTVYRYEYSFTIFSIDMMGGIFIASGAVLIFYALMSVFLIKPYAQPQLVVLYAIVVFIMCLLLFLLGVIGLSMNGNGEFSDQIKNNIDTTGFMYSLNDPFRHESKVFLYFKSDVFHKSIYKRTL